MRHEKLDVDTEREKFQISKMMRHFKPISYEMNLRQDKRMSEKIDKQYKKN